MKKTTLFLAGFLTALNLTAFAATFTDENEFADWNREAIFKANEKGLMTGYEDGRFGPNNYVTRAELATILERMEERMPALIDEYVEEKTAEALGEAQTEGAAKEASIDDDAILGDVNAPVTIVEFSDFQCPFCGKFHQETFPSIKENYIDTGKVRFVLRDFPLPFHPDAENAAMSAECVRDLTDDETYWTFSDLLFQNQSQLDVKNLKSFATGLSIDENEFVSCLESEKFKAEVQADMEEGKSYGVQGTPTFFIGKKMIGGAQPYATFEAAIEDALTASQTAE